MYINYHQVPAIPAFRKKRCFSNSIIPTGTPTGSTGSTGPVPTIDDDLDQGEVAVLMIMAIVT